MKHIILAVSLLFLSSCFTAKHVPQESVVVKSDTVYIPKEIPVPYAVHDTVYIDTPKSKVQLTINSDSLIRRVDTLTHKIVNARFCIYNIQDYVNLCITNPKLNKFEPSWIQRILKDYYFQSGEVAPTRKSLKAEKDKNKAKKK